MARSRNFDLIPKLAQGRRRFDSWREGHRQGRRRIPEPLWRLAVALASKYGIHRTSRSLGLSYMALKEQMGDRGALPSAAKPEFVEVVPAVASLRSGSLIELERPGGAKVRVQLSAGEALDIAALMRSFWEAGA